MAKSGDKSLWDLAIDQANLTNDDGRGSGEASVFFVGSKNSGKTSIILRFLDRDEAPKPTTALEYTFGRRAKGHNIAKDVGHIWELGGGSWLSKLIDIPITPETLMKLSIVIVVDLSAPNELWFTLETFLAAIRSKLEAVLTEIKADDPKIKEKLRRASWERIGEDHMDKEMIEPFPIPLAIIGGKFDLFQEFDPEKRKIICKTLRFVAHSYGAHLQFFSIKQEALLNKSRAMISHMVFGTAGGKTIQVDHNKPIMVPAGLDSLQQIGTPPLAEGDLGRVSARSPMELWKIAYTSAFPQEAGSNPAMVDDPAKDSQYKETAIDAMRIQKDEELERYRRLCERRAKEAQRQMNSGTVY